MDEKTVVLGFDGMDIRYLRKAMKERNLPNFERLEDNGVLGEMKSIHPPTTIPGWPCMFTGKNPGKLGAFHFQHLDRNSGDFHPFDMTELYGNFIWDSGIETSLNFLPSITPPYEINGRILEGIPGPKDFRTYPESLKKDMADEKELEVFNKDFDDKMEQSFAYYNTRKKIMRKIIEEYSQDLLINVYRPTDTVAHYRENIESFYDVYEKMDEELGYYLDRADEEDFNVFIVADHGANNTEDAFFVNTWLARQGYLELSSEGEQKEKDFLLTIANRLINIGLRKPLEIGNSMIQRFTGTSFKPNKKVSERIDWSQSDAVSYLIGTLPTTGIMLNEEKLGDNLDEKREEIMDKISDEDGIEWVKKREEIYSEENIEEIPHIIVKGNGKTMMKSIIYPDERIKFEKYGHGYSGVFGAYGNDIKNLKDFKCSLLDIAPTLLLSMNREIPDDLDGEGKKELFKDGREPEFREPINKQINEEDDDREEEIKNRLEEMGYMSS